MQRIKTASFGAYGLVVYRDDDGEAPAIRVSENESSVASLIVFDRAVTEKDDDEDESSEVLVVGRLVRMVPRGLADGTEPKPSWYELEAVADGGN